MRYERVNQESEVPDSPPPAFRSRASSPASAASHGSRNGGSGNDGRGLLSADPLTSDNDRALADSFDAPSDSEGESDGEHDESDRRLLRSRRTSGENNTASNTTGDRNQNAGPSHPTIERRVTQFPAFAPSTAPTRPTASRVPNDGVFANLSAKPELGEKTEEQPPTYEQAAADATPPYWETTILAPGVGPDEVFIDGLPVGSVFSFVWNGMISMSFQLVGFLLTYLLHTTHAAKNGSKAGLGITLVQFGFYMQSSKNRGGNDPGSPGEPVYGEPSDPNSHNFDPNAMQDGSGAPGQDDASTLSRLASSDWLAFVFMTAGWLILLRAVLNFIRARRHEQLVLQSPDRGLNVPIIAEGERSETVV